MKRTTLLLVLVAVFVMALSACGGDEALECTDTIGCVEIGPDDPILLASSLVISGPNTQLGLDSQWGECAPVYDAGYFSMQQRLLCRYVCGYPWSGQCP